MPKDEFAKLCEAINIGEELTVVKGIVHRLEIYRKTLQTLQSCQVEWSEALFPGVLGKFVEAVVKVQAE